MYNLAGVKHELHQLRHQGVSKSEGLKIGVHQSGKQHWKQMPQHGCLRHLFQSFQPENHTEEIKTKQLDAIFRLSITF